MHGVVGQYGVTVLLRAALEEEHVSEDATVQLLRTAEICVMDLILRLLNVIRETVQVRICIFNFLNGVKFISLALKRKILAKYRVYQKKGNPTLKYSSAFII